MVKEFLSNDERLTTNDELFSKAKKFISGGVSSPARSFKAVGGAPLFINRSLGSKIYGEDKREYIDYNMSWGAIFLGHSRPEVIEELNDAVKNGTTFGAPTKNETEFAKLICGAIPSVEKIRFTNSGTEAVMGAIRLARAFTKKNRIIKFEGCYHGHADYLLRCPGIPDDFLKSTIEMPYNDLAGVNEAVRKYKDDLAAIIVEPIAGNMGVVLPKKDFLKGLREIATRYKIVLIFDEVITGFRFAFGGVQKLFDIKPDLTSLGKIIGGGLPIGAFGGRGDIMNLLSPEGSVYQAGTFSGNPLSVRAGMRTLKILLKENPYKKLESTASKFYTQITEKALEFGLKIKINSYGSIFSIFFTDKTPEDYNMVKKSDQALFIKFYHGLLEKGVYLSPSNFEANFISVSHTSSDIEKTINAVGNVFEKLKKN